MSQFYRDLDEGFAVTREWLEARRAADAEPEKMPVNWGIHGHHDPAQGLCFSVLGSGSKGNACVLRAHSTSVLIDCGFSNKSLRVRMEEAKISPEALDALFITHEHTDHTQGLPVFARSLKKAGRRIPLFTHQAIYDNSSKIREACECLEFVPLTFNEPVHIKDLCVLPFEGSHDSVTSLGFRFEAQFDKVQALGYLTDSGVIPARAWDALKHCKILALETNHDPTMLKNGPYPPELKRRVAADTGHLANIQAHDALSQLIGDNTEWLIGMHLSEKNNQPRLVHMLLEKKLREINPKTRLICAPQHTSFSCS